MTKPPESSTPPPEFTLAPWMSVPPNLQTTSQLTPSLATSGVSLSLSGIMAISIACVSSTWPAVLTRVPRTSA